MWQPAGWMVLLLRLVVYGLALLALALVVQHGAEHAQRTVDTLRYGYPRSVSMLGYVGHGDERYLPTMMETLNLNGQIHILIFPGGDVQQLQVLEGPYVVGKDGAYVVAHPSLRDITGDGHVDLLVTIRDEVIVYVNDDGKFRPVTMEERAKLADEW
jgi:hypothetical protein